MRIGTRASTLAFSMVALLLLAACGSAVSDEQAAVQRTAASATATDPPSPTKTSRPTDTAEPIGTNPDPTATSAEPTATRSEPAEAQVEPTATLAGDELGYKIVTLLPPDAIPSIDDPKFYGTQEADKEYGPEELVLGVELDDEARAYSVGLLSAHEIVNDTLAGRPISVTW